jgi:hypothetical protein
MLTVGTWIWGDKFSKDHINKLREGVKRHLKQPYIWKVFRPEARDVHLTKVTGCFCRLRMFDPQWQERNGIDDRLVNLDLDTVIAGPLDELFDRPEPFVIMQGANVSNPCPMNGALMMLRPGAHSEVWKDFSLEAAKQVPYYSFPDDQGWIWHKLPQAAGWRVGSETGVYVYKKNGWNSGEDLPSGARLITFINNDPGKMTHLDWVRENWN